jgi:hypothetical protein
MQEDLTAKDTEEILEDLKNDRVPKAGPRYDFPFSFIVPGFKRKIRGLTYFPSLFCTSFIPILSHIPHYLSGYSDHSNISSDSHIIPSLVTCVWSGWHRAQRVRREHNIRHRMRSLKNHYPHHTLDFFV